MRDRLIELLTDAEGLPICLTFDGFADHLLSEGVIVPPCKVGDTVYKLIITSKGKPAIREIIVTHISIEIGENGIIQNSYVIGHLKHNHCGESADFCEFGKNVFLTKEEAEKALE